LFLFRPRAAWHFMQKRECQRQACNEPRPDYSAISVSRLFSVKLGRNLSAQAHALLDALAR